MVKRKLLLFVLLIVSNNFLLSVGKDVSRAKYDCHDLDGADLSEGFFTGTKFRKPFSDEEEVLDFCNKSLNKANLTRVVIRYMCLRGSTFCGATMVEADLSCSRAWDTDFSGANMQRADLSGIRASEAKFLNTNLSEANLAEDDFENSDFSYANFRDANFQPDFIKIGEAAKKWWNGDKEMSFWTLISDQRVRYSDPKPVNFKNANFTGVDLRGLDLSGINFCGANFCNVIIDDTTIVIDADFDKAINLTNDQKRYLHEAGAKNVPIEVYYELDPENCNVGTESYEVEELVDPVESCIRGVKVWWRRNFRSEDCAVQVGR